MSPRREGKDVWFSVAEAAGILGVKRQALYMAINEGRLEARESIFGKQIHASNVLAFGIRRGSNPEELVKKVKELAKANQGEMVLWLMLGLGLLFLVASLLNKDGGD